MDTKQIATALSRINGLSCPVFGISWTPPEPELRVARRVLTYLEDRRVLYVDSEAEVPQHCVDSVLEIRRKLTDELGHLDSRAEIAHDLRAMRAACRAFLHKTNEEGHEIARHAHQRGHYASWTFYIALGELRASFGLPIARLATAYGLDVEDQLARVLPPLAEESGA